MNVVTGEGDGIEARSIASVCRVLDTLRRVTIEANIRADTWKLQFTLGTNPIGTYRLDSVSSLGSLIIVRTYTSRDQNTGLYSTTTLPLQSSLSQNSSTILEITAFEEVQAPDENGTIVNQYRVAGTIAGEIYNHNGRSPVHIRAGTRFDVLCPIVVEDPNNSTTPKAGEEGLQRRRTRR